MNNPNQTTAKSDRKECSNCHEVKSLSEFKFSKASGMYYGHCYKCFMQNKEQYVSNSEPMITIPLAVYNQLKKDSQILETVINILQG